MLKHLLLKTIIGLIIAALIAYFKTGLNQEGISQALYIVSAIYLCVGALLFVTTTERKIIDDLGRKQGMSDQELKYIYRNIPTTQNTGLGWFDAFGGDKRYISSGILSAGVTFLIGLIALIIALGLSN